MKISRSLIVIILALLALSATSYGAYTQGYLPFAQATPTPAMQTAYVRAGDLVILTTASGNILPATEVSLGFRASGQVSEINVSVGDRVEAGQVLARLDDTAAGLQNEQAKINLEALFSPAAILETEVAVANAQKALDESVDHLALLISPEVLAAEEELAQAQVAFSQAQNTGVAQIILDAAQTDIEATQARVIDAQNIYATEYITATFMITKADPVTKRQVTTVETPTAAEIEQARANLNLAERKLVEAQAYQTLLQKDAITDADLDQMQGAAFDRLKQARLAVINTQYTLDNTTLTTPFAGTITKVNASEGQTVSMMPVITLAALEQYVVRFYVEESELDKVKVGNAVKVTFEGYPTQELSGQIYEIEPVMGVMDGAPVLVVWASITPVASLPLYSGMSVEVEIISGEARNVLLVPVAALREISPGEYAVFVVQLNDQLKLTPVKVGLQDFSYAEILEGLQANDVVSTGNVATK